MTSKKWLSVVALALFAASARADLLVAQVVPMSGPIGVEGVAYNSGIRIALAAANALGGVHGQKIALETRDDEYNPLRTVAEVQRLGRSEALALIMPVGSPALTRLLAEKILEGVGMPVIGVVPGAEPFRKPHHPHLYHVRAGDLDQYRKIIEHSLSVGLRRVAVVYVDIPFGKSGLALVEGILQQHGLAPAARAAIGLTGPESIAASFAQIASANADLVLLISPARRAGEFVAAARDHGMRAPINTLSYGNADTICAVATPEKARGVGLAQVFPNIRNRGLRIVREYLDDLARYGEQGAKPSLMQFEAYVAARVLVEGLRRAGNAPNRARLMRALDGLRNFDLGGFVVDFSESKHTGSSFVDLSIIGRECQLVY
ncbi:MAG: ABC transporter substrate-binding protein [Betaproteobacteria bacterium]|nr:ABC transporter substrate-binding protein [Betaproteobacteria bacterium]